MEICDLNKSMMNDKIKLFSFQSTSWLGQHTLFENKRGMKMELC